jgi:chromosome partitioning protein
MQPRVIAVAMQKGGVGKTTVAVNLAAAMAGHFGLRTYISDFDGQCNATEAVLDYIPEGAPNLLTVLRSEASFADCALPTPHHANLKIVPGSEELAFLERKIAEAGRWDVAVRELPRLLRQSLPADADVILLDTPPSLGLWLQVALGVADEVVIVSKAEQFSVQGIRQLVDTVHQVKRTTNPRLRIAAVMLNMVRARTLEHAAFAAEYREQFGDRVLSPELPERIVIPASQRDAVPLEFYTDAAAGEPRTFFRNLASELLEKIGLTAALPRARA